MNQTIYQNAYYALELTDAGLNYRVAGTEEALALSWPQFQIEGGPSGAPKALAVTDRKMLTSAISELTVRGALDCGAALGLELRVCEESPILRFRYALSAEAPLRLTKAGGGDDLTYFAYPSEGAAERMEVRFSNYDSLVHGYCLNEVPAFQTEDELMGPILVEQRPEVCLLTAYEHGSQYPDKFVAFVRTPEGIALKALRGNYWSGQPIDRRPYETIWLQAGAVRGDREALAKAYRTFQLRWCTLNAESRKPYIFYNTWAFQERNKFYNGQAYLTSMNQQRMEEEIEIAHRMGVDVFVIDTGWYQKTGDWEANLSRFPDGLASIRRQLERYGMKLGLWFNPTVAAVSSRILRDHSWAKCVRRDRPIEAFSIWETEESYPMCLVSDYWEAFADELIRLADEVGVRYFKWDAVDMYGCQSDGHLHGGPGCSAKESEDCYAFQIGQYMSKVVDKLCRAHPDAIVDVDITEGRRYFGLGFLSSGKFFSMNNGPYYPNYDIEVPEDVWINIFVNPGPARAWVIRQNLCYDKWIPSVLMMAHYLPDDPERSQMLNLGSLILGQNGIWGDLPKVSEAGVQRFHDVLEVYKRVRDDVTAAYPFAVGRPGEIFEAHEKLNEENGRGAVVLFANEAGTYRYRMHAARAAEKVTAFGDVALSRDGDAIRLEANFDGAGAVILFFE